MGRIHPPARAQFGMARPVTPEDVDFSYELLGTQGDTRAITDFTARSTSITQNWPPQR